MMTFHAIPDKEGLEDSEISRKATKKHPDLFDGLNAEYAQNHLCAETGNATFVRRTYRDVFCSLRRKHKVLLAMKGAAEVIVTRCSGYLTEDGSVLPISAKIRAQLSAQQEKFGQKGERVLGFAYREVKIDKNLPLFSKQFDDDKDKFEVEKQGQDLVFVGLLALMDPRTPNDLFPPVTTPLPFSTL